jgi:hypothetical protein
MPIRSHSAERRMTVISEVLTTETEKRALKKAIAATKGDVPAAIEHLKARLADAGFQRISLANSLAEWSSDNPEVVKTFAEHPNVASLRDVALHFDANKLASTLPAKAVPKGTPGDTPKQRARNYAATLHQALFASQTSAVIQRMVQDKAVPIADDNVRSHVVNFLNRQPDFDIRRTSIYTALRSPDILKDVPEKQRGTVIDHLKTLQRVQALAPVPEAVTTLMKANLTSAFRVTEMPESTFLESYGDALGSENARQVYTNALNARLRNEHALITMRESVKGTGLSIIDGPDTMEKRREKLQAVADKHAVPLNLETMFGSMDFCECDDCMSVYSPASYFVELLQYLRNNNLDPKNPNKSVKGIVGTPLEKLFRRRPDLGCLELTCENTFTVLPYADLANEIMESFIVHADAYHASTTKPKQTTLDVFNVTDETTGELLAQPQHVNMQAYCILKNSVYPFTLPYHQPIDSIRIFLEYLGTSRCEVLKRFRTATENVNVSTFTAAQVSDLKELHEQVMRRATGAEFLGMTQEEYIILTREAFWPKAYFALTQSSTLSDSDYRKKIGVRAVFEYYGYTKQSDMLDAVKGVGLRFVKRQFLPRTGIQYVDLVALLKTRSINPNYPQGKALEVMESLHFSYRFLQSLVDTSSTDPRIRFAKLIDFLNKAQALFSKLDAMLHPDPCHSRELECCSAEQRAVDFTRWVRCYFERIGKLIVLEAGDGPTLQLFGDLYRRGARPQKMGSLEKDGTILDLKGRPIGKVTADLKVVDIQRQPLTSVENWVVVSPSDPAHAPLGFFFHGTLLTRNERPVAWLPAQDSCDLEKVRLVHLDGSPLQADEYDRMQRFMRLWRRLSWTIPEVDQAVMGYGAAGGVATPAPVTGSAPTPPAEIDQFVTFDAFKDDCTDVPRNAEGCGCGSTERNPKTSGSVRCPDEAPVTFDITTDLVEQLVAIKKLLERMGLPLTKLLSFWSNISTAGEPSLYAKLFLSHSMLGIDNVFKADPNGEFLSTPARITDHIPVLMAALRLKADDIATIVAFRGLPDSLTLSSVSVLYRHSLLGRVLKAKVADLPRIIGLLGDPFTTASDALRMLRAWSRMEDAGFNFRQLDYLINDHDDPLRPLAPQQKTVLRLSKTLYDGLIAIETEHRDFPTGRPDLATDDAVRLKAGLLFDGATVDQIVALLDGTTIYTTNAPLGLNVAIPPALKGKVRYIDLPNATPPTANLQLTGILTASEVGQAKAILSSDPGWGPAIDRAGKQARHFFDDVLFGIFSNVTTAATTLLAGDVIVPADQVNLSLPDPNSAPAKRLYFLQQFIPFLRQQLSRRFIVEAVSAACSLDADVTDVLLADVLTAGTPKEAALTVLQNIRNAPAASPGTWQGYLIPPASGDYTLVVTSNTPPQPVVLDGKSIGFPNQQDDPNNVWSSAPVTLARATLYRLEMDPNLLPQFQWKTPVSPRAAVGAAALLPDYSISGMQEVLNKLFKAAIFIDGFDLGVDEVRYLQTHAADFAGFDFNQVVLTQWQSCAAYASLRDSLPKFDTTLLDLFAWASAPDNPSLLTAKIAAVTGWKVDRIARLIHSTHFDLDDPAAFRNARNLLRLQKALVVADKTGMDIDSLFKWANPSSEFWPCHAIATDVQKALRARYDVSDWEQLVKPLNDRLRQDQQQALIAYLLVQPDLVEWGVEDADSLFEFFLIDMQMCACMQTSRIKQAISSVQTFIQRCMIGLEDPDVSAAALDRERWKWMQKYRVWEANRKVFLYPENWLRTDLRDDKSPFYEQLESELLQKDINPRSIEDALKTYLFKVDDVAHLQVVGFFQDAANQKLHVFARTHGAPYHFYYRYFDEQESNWYAWEKVEVDIPSYDVDTTWQVKHNGAYLTPVVWNNRLLLFFPQIVKKTAADYSKTGSVTAKKDDDDNYNVDSPPAPEFWEIRLAWSEYRNGKWTQKQISKDCYNTDAKTGSIVAKPPIDKFAFVPRISYHGVNIMVFDVGTAKPLTAFDFLGSQLFIGKPSLLNLSGLPDSFHFYTQFMRLRSIQISEPDTLPEYVSTTPYFQADSDSQQTFHANLPALPAQNFYHPFTQQLLGKLNTDNLNELYRYYQQGLPPLAADDAFGVDVDGGGTKSFHELKRPYALYNWELGFHTPMALMAKLAAAQQFDSALEICHFVFDPAAKGTDARRFWQFPPFKQIDATNTLETLFRSLQPGQPNDPINEWRNNPFEPHVVARQRPSAYMKWTVMQYIRTLIDCGDFYFRQNTLETLPTAIQYYILASHLYGKRAQRIPRRGKVVPETYNSLLDRWDAFGNAMVELEIAFPFSNQTLLPLGSSNGVVGFANVFGFATSLYFCIPMNPQLAALRDTIDDRLFKIRHCEDINGVFRQLPLFEPELDPGLLVEAAAQGLSLASVLNDLNSPMPNYRFYYFLQKALEMCNELKSLGGSFLAAKEKGDAEALAALRAAHESTINNLVMEVRKQQLDEAQKSLEALQQNRQGPVFRLRHYSRLIGVDLGSVPDADTDFNEIADPIDAPVDESGLQLSPLESKEMALAKRAADLQQDIGQMETLASIMNLIPNFSINIQPIGCGASISFGGSNIGAAMQAMARQLQMTASDLTYQSTNAGRKAGYQRQLQDRVLQANIAGYEIKNIDKQILTQRIRVSIAQQEIANQQKQIDNAQEVSDFLRDKYTNVELYSWMQDSLRGLHYQAYTLAYDLAKRAEKLFHFERGATDTSFVQFGYWDTIHDGLLAGDKLYSALKQMEVEYLERRGYDFEIPTKQISLRQLNPLALVELRETGRCEFTLPEVLFDMDYPGHYMRRIKSVAVTVPCVVGPYTSLSCTLRLLEHKYRTNSVVKDKNDYPERTDDVDPDDRFVTTNVPITAIAVSNGQNDAGLFELNFRDERYLPFEGAGVISKWRLELASKFRQFDYDTMSDVIINVRYTSMDGGDKLRVPAEQSVLAYIKSIEDLSQNAGLFAAFDLRHDFPNEWYKATQAGGSAVITLVDLYERLPIFTKGRKPGNIQATDIYVFAGGKTLPTGITVQQGSDNMALIPAPKVGEMKPFSISGLPGSPMDTWQISLQGMNPDLEKIWLVARYTLH